MSPKEIGNLTFVLLLCIEASILLAILLATIRTRILEIYRVISVCLYMLLEILRPLKGLATEIASMRFQRNVNSNVRGDVVPFHDGNTTAAPCARQVEVVCAFATNMAFAHMLLTPVRYQTCDDHRNGPRT